MADITGDKRASATAWLRRTGEMLWRANAQFYRKINLNRWIKPTTRWIGK